VRNDSGGRAYGERVTEQRMRSGDLVKPGTFFTIEPILPDLQESNGRKFGLRILKSGFF
jgi:hypothetical protein